MNIERKQIESVESPDNRHPWYVVEVDDSDGEVAITEDKDGGRGSSLSKARTAIPDHVNIPDQTEVSGSGWVRYAVTEDGEFISYDPYDRDANVPELRAHLGTYNPNTDTLELLEFVEQ